MTYNRIFTLIAAFAICFGATGCSGSSRRQISDKKPAYGELPMPSVPASILEPSDRADYALLHFWDGVDFTDLNWTADTLALEQNFSNYAQFFAFASDEGGQAAADTLLNRAARSPQALGRIVEVADKYLYDPNSPMHDERAYIFFLKRMVSLPELGQAGMQRAALTLEQASKNRPGMRAADFRFATRDSKESTLFSQSAPYLLLAFYDPDCESCHQIIERVRNDARINDLISRGIVKILAIDDTGERPRWNRTAASMPGNWTVGFDLTGVDENDLYVNRAAPTMYLMDADKKILIKDATLEQLMDFAYKQSENRM